MKREPKRPLKVNLSERLFDAYRKEADRMDRSVNQLIEFSLEAMLASWRKAPSAPGRTDR
jgi:hypothetical protein